MIFGGESVLGILEGRKTQTRRILSPQPYRFDGQRPIGSRVDKRSGLAFVREAKPRGRKGDRIWVREVYQHPECPLHLSGQPGMPCRCQRQDLVNYRATSPNSTGGWSTPMFMPRWASRIDLEIVDVRCERLHDITEEDAKAEGVNPVRFDPEGDCWTATEAAQFTPHRVAYEYAWNELHGWNINGAPAWTANLFVWRYVFKRLRPTTNKTKES